MLAGGVAELGDLLIVPMRETIQRRVRMLECGHDRIAHRLDDRAAVARDLARVHAVIDDPDAEEQGARDDAVAEHLEDRALDALLEDPPRFALLAPWTLALVGVSVPNFWLGPLLAIVFAVQFGWLPVAALSAIKVLDLEKTNVTDEGMKKLQALTNLKWLLICDTTVTDAGMHPVFFAINTKLV